MQLSAIQIGERHRRDMGDIKELADSIDTVGLIHPVVVTPDNKLLAGGRRIAAVKSLGWESIPVTVIHTLGDATDALLAERDENTCRKDFTPTEAAAIRAAVAEAIKPLAEEREKAGVKTEPCGNFPQGHKTRDVAAKGTGYSGKTLDKVDKTAALAADPEQPQEVRAAAQEALDEMDATGKVDKAFKKALAAVKKQPPTEAQLAAHHETQKLVAEQETLNRWSRAVDSLTNALSYAKSFTPPNDIPPNYVSVQEFKTRLAALCKITDEWKGNK